MLRHSPSKKDKTPPTNPENSQNQGFLGEQGGIEERLDAVDEDALALLLAENGWTEPRPYYFFDLKHLSPLASPFANVSVSEDLMLAKGISSAVQQAFRGFQPGPPPEQTSTFGNGTSAYLGVLRQAEPDIFGEQDLESAPYAQYHTINAGQNVFNFSLNQFVPPTQETEPMKGKTFQIRRQQRLPDLLGENRGMIRTEEEFFIVSHNCSSLTVNNEGPLGRGAVVGPLSPFTVLEIDSVVLFWWRGVQALEYAPTPEPDESPSILPREEVVPHDNIPSLKRKTPHDEDVNDGQNSGNLVVLDDGADSSKKLKMSDQSAPSAKGVPAKQPVPSNQPSPFLQRWREIFDEKMVSHRQCRAEKEREEKRDRKKAVSKIPELEDIAEDDTIRAIATFWEGLRQQGRSFAYAGMDVFDMTEYPEPEYKVSGSGIVDAPNDFIMPHLTHHQRKKGPTMDWTTNIGHHTLVVSHWNEKERRVESRVWDSWEKEQQERLAGNDDWVRSIITGSNWPYDQTKSQEPQATFNSILEISPRQEGQNTCGFYLIVNAWCVMLGIPIYPHEKRRGNPRAYKTFHARGLEILNLALDGCMDAVTVQAYLNIYGYTEDQNPESLVQNVSAAAMNEESLSKALASKVSRSSPEVEVSGSPDDDADEELQRALRESYASQSK